VSEVLTAARAQLAGQEAWVVGGAVRDRLLGRPTEDLDLAVRGDPAAHARALARACRGAAFPLSEEHAAWRVVGPDRSWHVDFMPLEGTIEDDLARRDFTVNAIAEPLAGGPRLDPFGGRADLEARRLRMVGPASFTEDPLRVLRAARLACQLDLQIERATAAAARAQAAGLGAVAPERVFAELRQLVCAPDPVRGLELMDAVGATPVVLPELSGLGGVEQSPYHHLDVYDHTLAVLGEVVALERDPRPALGEHAEAVAALLAEPLADEMTRAGALRFGALLHDAAKPQTRDRTPEGRVTFIGHDEAGAELARAALTRLRASERLRAHVAALTRHHLRLGFLVHDRPLSRRAVHRYLRACQPVEVDVTLLSVADRLATRGRRADEAIAAHLELARELVGEALRWRAAGPPAPLVRGDELARALGIEPGPQLGHLLDALEEAQFAGEVSSPEEAVRLARKLLVSK
jgi:putative nucleotidyltransferase with HDIG domain